MAKKNISFTLVEILIVMVVMGILASLAVTSYQKTIRLSNDRKCLQNLKVLRAAVEIYTLENSSLPTTLSKLDNQQIYLAYQKVVGKVPKENCFIACYRKSLGIEPAMAQTTRPSLGKYYAGDKSVLKCPLDNSTNTISYQLNPNTTNEVYNNPACVSCTITTFPSNPNLTPNRLINSVYALIYESNPNHSDPMNTSFKYYNGITPGGIRGRLQDFTDKKVLAAVTADATPNGNGNSLIDGNELSTVPISSR